MDEILDILNEEQLLPVKDTQGQVLVLAGAGSGKTRVLTSRIAYILREGFAMPYEILAITFTNKAAGEMRERLERMVGDTNKMWICTIHSMCVKILRMYSAQVGIKENFSIYSETERNNVIKKVYKECDYDDEKLLKEAKFHISNAKMLGLDPDLYAERNRDERYINDIKNIFCGYNEHLNKNNALDFDDLLLYTLRLLRSNEEALDYLSGRFKYIHVDEFQDTNAVQYNIIKLLAYKHANLFAVGDDDQSIYGWRGAEIENILKFDRDYPSAKVYKLQRNYRSNKPILDLANGIIKKNSLRHSKTLWTSNEGGAKPVYFEAEDETGEALFTARTIYNLVQNGAKYSDFAVLMRINALTRSYESEFTKYGIPFKVFGGFKFFERKEIKDILAYMRLISNPDDNEALERIINFPKRGIGAKTLDVMQSYATEFNFSLYDACIDVDYLSLTKKNKENIRDFANLIKGLVQQSMSVPVNQLVRSIISESKFKSAFDKSDIDYENKNANINEYIASVDDFVRLNPEATLSDYLNMITLYSDTDEIDDSSYVTIATIHSVKGLEFDSVFVCGLEEGIMPSQRSNKEEERRLMYVAITRAKTKLYLTRSKSHYLYDHREIALPSPFAIELASMLGAKVGGSSRTSFNSGSGMGYGGFCGRSTTGYGGYNSGYDGYNSGYGGGNNGRSSMGYVSGFGGYRGKPNNMRRNELGGTYARTNDHNSDYYGGNSYYGDDSSDYGYYSDEPYEPTPKKQTPAQQNVSTSQKSTVKPGLGGFVSQKPATQNSSQKYAVGIKVFHAKFGIGTIISIKNQGTSGEILCVAFDKQGIKELSSAFAPLKII